MKQIKFLLLALITLASCSDNNNNEDEKSPLSYKQQSRALSQNEAVTINEISNITYSNISIRNDGKVNIDDSSAFIKEITYFDENGHSILTEYYDSSGLFKVKEYDYVNYYDYKYRIYMVGEFGEKELMNYGNTMYKDDNTLVTEQYPSEYLRNIDIDDLHDTSVTTFTYHPKTETIHQVEYTHNGHPINNKTNIFDVTRKENKGDTSISHNLSVSIANNDTTFKAKYLNKSIALAKNKNGDITKELLLSVDGSQIISQSLTFTEYKYFE